MNFQIVSTEKKFSINYYKCTLRETTFIPKSILKADMLNLTYL